MGERNEQVTYRVNSPKIQHLCKADARLSLVINRYGELTYTLRTDECSFFVETIIGQMLSNKAADAIAARLYTLCGGELSVSAISNLEQATIRGVGLSDQKAAYIKGFVSLIQDTPDYFVALNGLKDKEILRRLTSIRGIGMWSAKMYLIFVLNRLDVLPFEDGAFLQAYKWLRGTDDVTAASISEKCKIWRPYTSLAARYLYRALDNGLTRDPDLQKKLATLNLTD